jgi:hypothetical protein
MNDNEVIVSTLDEVKKKGRKPKPNNYFDERERIRRNT